MNAPQGWRILERSAHGARDTGRSVREPTSSRCDARADLSWESPARTALEEA
jgi:hypothetical protein